MRGESKAKKPSLDDARNRLGGRTKDEEPAPDGIVPGRVVRVFAYDGAFADIRDADGYRAEAALAKRLGFIGKSCIHPSQVATANEVFRASDEAVAAAQRVLDAARSAGGRGAFVVDGKMIDAPFVARAEQVVSLARKLGLVAD